MNKDFRLFQQCFKEWQQKFGLTGYKVYFKHEPLEKDFACIDRQVGDAVATVRLNSNLPDKDRLFKDIEGAAKHEAIHLLVARIDYNARYRYATSAELYEAEEELVVKLEGLIT